MKIDLEPEIFTVREGLSSRAEYYDQIIANGKTGGLERRGTGSNGRERAVHRVVPGRHCHRTVTLGAF